MKKVFIIFTVFCLLFSNVVYANDLNNLFNSTTTEQQPAQTEQQPTQTEAAPVEQIDAGDTQAQPTTEDQVTDNSQSMTTAQEPIADSGKGDFKAPKTADESTMSFSILIMGIAAIIGIALYGKKKSTTE